jgi:hypothetical protein
MRKHWPLPGESTANRDAHGNAPIQVPSPYLPNAGTVARETKEHQVPNATDQDINIAYPDAGDLQLKIIMGPGQLRIAPSTNGDWVTGTYRDPTGNIPLRVETSGNKAKIAQSLNFPSLKWPRGTPELELSLGAGRSYTLVIEGGANEITAEFGGLPLDRFECRIGAGQCRLRFGEPNPRPMDRLQFTAGAAEATVSGLANANAAEIAIEAGAAALHLDFGGTLVRDSKARVNAGAAALDLTLPGTTAAVAGETPVFLIDANVTLSGLKLRAT